MTSDQRTEQFLSAEAEASRLLEELTELRKETASYAGAHGALTGATAHIDSLAERLSAVGDSMNSVALSLREIGTPAILEGQEALGLQLSAAALLMSGIEASIDDLRRESKTTRATVVVFGILSLVAATVVVAVVVLVG